MTTDNAGNIWVATDNGVSLIDANGQVLEHLTTEDGLPGTSTLTTAICLMI